MNKQNQRPYNGDELVMLCSIRNSQDAETIKSLLESEDIPCWLRNENSNMVMGGLVDLGGIRIDICKKDIQKAIEILSINHIEIPNEQDTTIGHITDKIDEIPMLSGRPLEQKLWIVVGLLVGLLLVAAIVGYLIAR